MQKTLHSVTAALAIFAATSVFAEDALKPWQENAITLLSRITKPLPVENADAATEDAMKPYTEIITGTDATFDMVPIRSGKFMMGSTAEEQKKFAPDPGYTPEFFDTAAERPRHEVQVSAFWMGKCEVTWEVYEASWLSRFSKDKETVKSELDEIADAISMPSRVSYTDMTFGMGKMNRPALGMSLYAAQMYCKWLSAKTGRYYRLPTEAEWEYACRAGTDTAFSFGNNPEEFGDYGWCYTNADDKYQPVGQKKSNPWGLYDMHGNVREWCLDQYFVDGYQKQLTDAGGKMLTDPFMPFKKAQRYPGVTRGGSWYDDVQNCRSAARIPSHEGWNADDPQVPKSISWESSEKWLGFRVLRPFKTPTAEEVAPFEPDPEVASEYSRTNPREAKTEE